MLVVFTRGRGGGCEDERLRRRLVRLPGMCVLGLGWGWRAGGGRWGGYRGRTQLPPVLGHALQLLRRACEEGNVVVVQRWMDEMAAACGVAAGRLMKRVGLPGPMCRVYSWGL